MTDGTIKHLAMGLAGQFYEQKRSGRFRSMGALTRAKKLMQTPDGRVVEVPVTVPFRQAYPTSKEFAVAHWPLFVDAARRCLVTMLALPDSRVSPHEKETIHAALIADRVNEHKHGGKRLLQQKAGDHVGK